VTTATTAKALARRIGWKAWLVIGGSVGVAAGSAAQGAVGALNVNGVGGAWPVLLVGAAATGLAEAVGVPTRPAVARWRDVPIGVAAGLLVLGLLDLAELVRGISDVTIGGPIGVLGRVLVAGSAVALLAGIVIRRREAGGASWIDGVRATPRYHPARVGGVVVAVGWSVLVTQGQGFAIRTIDALGLIAVAVIVAGLGSSLLGDAADRRPGRAVAAGLAAVTVVIGLDTLLVVVGHLDAIGIGGPTTGVGYVLYIAGVVIVGFGGAHSTVGLRWPRRAVQALP